MNNRCRSCGQKIIWAMTKAERRIPLDPTPVLNGNIVLEDVGRAYPIAIYVQPEPQFKHYISHFVTCPQAGKWRKKKGTPG